MKRLFAALKITPDELFMEQFRDMKLALGYEKIKWVEENNIHVTLKFFGDTEEAKIPGIIGVLEKTARSTHSFTFLLNTLGIFGSSYDPKVVWIGIEPFETLRKLMNDVHEDLRSIGFEPDRQNLVPHLTLGRIKFLKDKRLFREILEEHKLLHSGKMTAREFHLYESILRKEGPLYTSLATLPFLTQNTP
ncbi:MAG TPA: RNA 2',3'-cyclic phosphodiesterase [Bacteroidales bacterium]|nr:RNA 2',3'-cyclic phosphodiesterase [Bacteroidales bacterium]